MENKNLNHLEAYKAMYEYLFSYYKRINSDSDDIQCLLSDLLLMQDGKPADPAIWEDWLEAIEKSQCNEASDIQLKLTK